MSVKRVLGMAGVWTCLVAVAVVPMAGAATRSDEPQRKPEVPRGDGGGGGQGGAAVGGAPVQPGAPADGPTVDPGLPDLDELLGLPSASKPRQPDAAKPAETDKDLQRRLSAQEMGDAFKQAITLMGDAAERLEKGKDPGLPTQRVQEDVLRRLDELISQLERSSNQQQQSSSSSSQQRREDPRNSDEAGKQQSQQQTQGEQTAGENTGQVNPPPLQEGALRPALESAPAAWGGLPARIRDMLMQGAGDRFSTTWERATESYYRRLAEQRPE